MVLVGNYNGSFPGAVGNPNFARYTAVLEAINVLQGGTRAATGKAGEPIEFLRGYTQNLGCQDDLTRQRLVGALVGAFPQVPATAVAAEIDSIHLFLMNPTAIIQL